MILARDALGRLMLVRSPDQLALRSRRRPFAGCSFVEDAEVEERAALQARDPAALSRAAAAATGRHGRSIPVAEKSGDHYIGRLKVS